MENIELVLGAVAAIVTAIGLPKFWELYIARDKRLAALEGVVIKIVGSMEMFVTVIENDYKDDENILSALELVKGDLETAKEVIKQTKGG